MMTEDKIVSTDSIRTHIKHKNMNVDFKRNIYPLQSFVSMSIVMTANNYNKLFLRTLDYT